MRTLMVFLWLIGTVASAQAQDWAKARLEKSPRHLEYVDVVHGKRTVKCFVAYPEVAGKVPAVLLIHEIFGLTDWARWQADELAAAGYLVLVPDLLSGMGPNGGGTRELGGDDAAREATGKLPPEQVTADLDAAYAQLASLPACSGKISVAGFCWGGTQSFAYACHNPKLTGACVFYGSGPKEPARLAHISCPVYGFYAEKDGRIGETLPETIRLMKAAGKTFEPKTYTGAGHGFMRAGAAPDADPGNARARGEAWQRWLGLLQQWR